MHRGLLCALVLPACASSRSAPPPTPAAPTHVELVARVRASASPLARFGRGVVGAGLPRILLPALADAPTRIGYDPARGLGIRPLEVANVAHRVVDGARVYPRARPSTDLLLAAEADRFEEVRVLHDRAAPSIARWAITPGQGITELTLDAGVVRAFDAAGRVMVQSARMFAVDAKGVRREPTLALARRGPEYELSATLDGDGLTYPIVLDPVWLLGGSMVDARYNFGAVLLGDGRVVVAGGLQSAEMFDPKTVSFTSLSAVASMGSVRHAFLGSDGKARFVADSVYTYDPAGGTWTTGGAPTTVRTGYAAAAVSGNSVLVMGGSAGTSPSSTVDLYDSVKDTWSNKASMANVREVATAVTLASGRVLVAGGTTGGTTAELYDPTADSWSATGALPYELWTPGVLKTSAGVLFAGGANSGGLLAKTVSYDPATGTFTTGSSLTLARQSPAAALLGTRVLVIGGGAGTTVVDEAPSITGTFTAGMPMGLARSEPVAVTLADGRVLVLGASPAAFTTTTELLSSQPAGVACVWGAECASGFCVSGVCCDSACAGECGRCDLVGSVGKCSPAPISTECGAVSTCSGATLTPRGRCSGTDTTTCKPSTPLACPGALQCADGNTCLAACTADKDCTKGACQIATGLCVVAGDSGVSDDGKSPAPVPEGAPKLLGHAQACKSPSECGSGFCVDGVCCDTACKERCHSCALPSSPGRCAAEPRGVDLRNECGAALSCTGTCGRAGVCTTSVEGAQCQPSVCTGPTTGKGAAVCVRRGVPCDTNSGFTFDCKAYICDPAFGACRTSCTSSDGCAPGFACNLETASCEAPAAAATDGCSLSTRAVASGGTLVLSAAAMLGLSRRRRRRVP